MSSFLSVQVFLMVSDSSSSGDLPAVEMLRFLSAPFGTSQLISISSLDMIKTAAQRGPALFFK